MSLIIVDREINFFFFYTIYKLNNFLFIFKIRHNYKFNFQNHLKIFIKFYKITFHCFILLLNISWHLIIIKRSFLMCLLFLKQIYITKIIDKHFKNFIKTNIKSN